MKSATVRCTVSQKKRIEFEVLSDGVRRKFTGPSVEIANQLNAELAHYQFSDGSQQRTTIQRYRENFLSPTLASWIRHWASNPFDDPVLCVHAVNPILVSLPWADLLMPRGAVSGVAVARVASATGSRPPAAKPSVKMLMAGWANLTGYELPGVRREMNDFAAKIDAAKMEVRVSIEPTRQQLLVECEKTPADFLHLSPPALIDEGSSHAVPVTPDRVRPSPSSPLALVPLTAIYKALGRNKDLSMVVINACEAGVRGCGDVAKELKVVSIGWPALVTDDVAADFTFYFYQRLLEGLTPLQAVRSFAKTIGSALSRSEVPTVWLPSAEWVDWHPLLQPAQASAEVPSPATTSASPEELQPAPSATPAGALASDSAIQGAATSATGETAFAGVKLEFRPRPTINPALLVNGLHPIEHLSIESPVAQEVNLCIQCDTGANVSIFRQRVRLKTGAVPVNMENVYFPALHELVERHGRRRRVSFTATVSSANGAELASQTNSVLWMGPKEWLDQEDSWAFVPAFVNPWDDGVVKVFEIAKRVLRTLGEPGDTFCGYQPAPGRPEEYVSTQMKAIFQTLRDSVELTYISPPGSPVFDRTSKNILGQIVRTHTEVIDRKLGTCHDIALLIAACAEYIGVRPLLLLIPGHTFVGYWMTPQAQEKYWSSRLIRTGRFGESWTITDGSDISRLIKKREVVLLEATYVCERQRTFEEACRHRADEFDSKIKDLLDVAIDVFAARHEISPI